jgi:hypothetical protein
VTAIGNYAYVADGYGGLRIINIRDPLFPEGIGSFDTPGQAEDVSRQ